MPRKICETCHRPKSVCLCAHFVYLQAPCKVIILQHPSEQKQALATVPILQHCLASVEVYVGEQFDQLAALQQALSDYQGTRLLYPNHQAQVWQPEQVVDGASSVRTLLVIDGSWRKAKRMYLQNPILQRFSSIALEGFGQSDYRIRSTRIRGGLSTLEAVMHCLNTISGTSDYDSLSQPFNAMVDMQIGKMGAQTYRAHYEKDQ